MTNNIAIFLDLDNLVIGAKQLNLDFDINLLLNHIKVLTNGRIVLRRAYGDWRQNKRLLEELTTAGFVTQSTIQINNFGKNLADMQIVVDTMDTLIDERNYNTYVLMSGDRDFTPLVQALRKRDKYVIGMGIKHATSQSLVSLCDQYIYYEDLVPTPELTDLQVEELLAKTLNELLKTKPRVHASILKQELSKASHGAFDTSQYAEKSFRKFLNKYPTLVAVHQEGTTTFVSRPQKKSPPRPLHLRYRSELKRQRLRLAPAESRLTVLKDIVALLNKNQEIRWRQLIDMLADRYLKSGQYISKNIINAVMLAARQAQIIHSMKGRALASSPVLLQLEGKAAYQEAIIRCDAVYLRAILDLPEFFDLDEATIALYDDLKHKDYIQNVLKKWMKI